MAEKYLYGPLYGHTVKNPLTNDSNDFFLRIRSRRKYNLRQIANLVASEGYSGETPERIEESVRLVLRKAMELTLQGNTIDLEVIRMRSSVSGKFTDATAPYLQHLHQVNPVLSPGTIFTIAARHTQVVNNGLLRSGYIGQVINTATGAVNASITPTYPIKLYGMRMRVANNGDLRGALEILSADTSEVVVSIPPEDLLNNEPKSIIFRVPEEGLIPGNEYTLRIKTYLGPSRMPVKQARIIQGDMILRCEAVSDKE